MATIGQRKADHLALCAEEDVGFHGTSTLLECVHLVHDALPDMKLSDVDLSVTLFGKKLRAPLIVASMTGGTDEAGRINRELASIAEERGYGFGLGSQRAMHLRPGVADSYRVRDVAPTKLIQPGGDRDFGHGLDTLRRLARDLGVPVVVKETGCGISPAVGRRLREVGIQHVDVSGAGGTSWVGVETRRAAAAGDRPAQALGDAFWDWGVPTGACVALLAPMGFETIVATGGVASGLDVARALALGASAAGLARPILRALMSSGGRAAAIAQLDAIEAELRAAMLLTGCRDLAALRRAPRVVTGSLASWVEQLSPSHPLSGT
jgi:isopentenyl-diphosphate delta-isomerase